MTTRRPGCCVATAAARWKKCFSTWRAAMAPSSARPPNESPFRLCCSVFGAPHLGNDAAALVSVAFILAPPARSHLLADRADGDLGIPAILHRHQCRLLRPRRRYFYRRGTAVGYFVPRPARFFDFVPGGNVLAQPRQ